MTPNPTFSNPTSNHSKNLPPKSKKLPRFLGKIVEGRIEGRTHQKKKKIPAPRCPTCLLPPLHPPWRCFSSAAVQQSLFCLHHWAPPLASHCCSPPLPPLILLIVVFCCCRQRRCCPSTTDRPPRFFSRRRPPNSHSSNSTTAPCLSPAIVVIRLCHCTLVDCCFLSLSSVPL
jgi:hypothetical protein